MAGSKLTPEILEARHGVNLGFFYLREVGQESGETKCNVFIKGGVINVWDGAKWRPYSDYQPSENIDSAIDNCQVWNGSIP